MIRIKRTYEPASPKDGRRILVERLWPRGMKKEALKLDDWMKEVAPSTKLRKWFGHEPERWEEFERRYRKELDANPEIWEPLGRAAGRGTVTLLYSAHDTLHNGALVLRDYLKERRAYGPRARRGGRRLTGKAPPRSASGGKWSAERYLRMNPAKTFGSPRGAGRAGHSKKA